VVGREYARKRWRAPKLTDAPQAGHKSPDGDTLAVRRLRR